jgi:exoribonuclease R
MVCDMRVDRNGEVDKFDFCEALIYSHARLTYNQVQDFLEGDQKLPVKTTYAKAVAKSVRALNKVHDLMRGARDRRGALDFETHEAVLTLQHGRVVDIQAQQRLSAHQLIEEAMIAANVCAARFLEANETPALYRVHEPRLFSRWRAVGPWGCFTSGIAEGHEPAPRARGRMGVCAVDLAHHAAGHLHAPQSRPFRFGA